MRYGENPHQKGVFYGKLDEKFDKLHGKALSYNNLVDIDAAVGVMAEFMSEEPTFAVLKHTNTCGLATRPTVLEAWQAALAGDNISAFGGILICNRAIDLATAKEIDQIFYEVLISPGFAADALEYLQRKKTRILLRMKDAKMNPRVFKVLLNGVIEQDNDLSMEIPENWENMTAKRPDGPRNGRLVICKQMREAPQVKRHCPDQEPAIGGGWDADKLPGLTPAPRHRKAGKFGFDLNGAVMASDAFFPFADCVELAHQAGITAVIQPGGSKRDQESVDYCNEHGLSMVKTGVRHFKH